MSVRVRLNILALSYLFPNSEQPGYGVFVLNRLKAIQKFCNLKVVAPVQWYPFIHHVRANFWGSVIPRREEIGGIDVYHPRFPVVPRYMKWFDAISYFLAVRSVVEMLIKAENFEFDLVDVHWTYPDIVAGYFLARKHGKKFIVTVRGREALYLKESSLRRLILAHFLRRADYVVALSDELKEIVARLGVSSERIQVVLNGVDRSCFYPRDRGDCREKLGLPAEAKIIVSVGRLSEGKGHGELVRIMPGLSAKENVVLYIIGGVNPEDDYSHALYALIRNLELTNVYLLDKVEHQMLPVWYSAADLFCLASRDEGCPNVILEALACGTPVVSTDVGAVAKIVLQGKNGLMVSMDEFGSLEHTIRNALARTWNHEEIAASMDSWGWSSCAEKVVYIYRLVLNEFKKEYCHTHRKITKGKE
jgi:glycosyltransferase involved in cell wall biosynthesis